DVYKRQGGGLRVGPVSAGARPGPACYGLGGSKPTVTDANLILGRLPDTLAGGSLRLHIDLARRALENLADEAGLGLVEAAWGVVRIANTVMARAIRIVTVERGRDPRQYTLYAFGGAGPLHAVEVAMEIGVERVVVPPYPGVFSSLGLLLSDYRHDYHKSILGSAGSGETWRRVEGTLGEMVERAYRDLEGEGIGRDKAMVARFVELRYKGQSLSLRVPYNGDPEEAVGMFEDLYRARYGFTMPGEEVEVSLARVVAWGVVEKPRLPQSRATRGKPRAIGSRRVYMDGGWVDALLYKVEDLHPGHRAPGPGLVLMPDSTLLVPPGYGFTMLEDRSIVVEAW
ncbi:MAG: hydantoinase/oxoprolinase family protein, partial [Desulfurococcales archaeon]|nr:hydantoinase/oxoprolinase family protein [Desulfurococcales archaeon]